MSCLSRSRSDRSGPLHRAGREVVHPVMGPEGRRAGDRARHAAKRVEQAHQGRKVASFELDDAGVQDQPRPQITVYVAVEGAHMAAQDRCLLEDGHMVYPLQQMSGHEAGAPATDYGDIQAVTLQLPVFAYGLHGRSTLRRLEATMARRAINPRASARDGFRGASRSVAHARGTAQPILQPRRARCRGSSERHDEGVSSSECWILAG